MQEIIKWLIGIVVLLLGIPLGNWLAKTTKEELKAGKKWFRRLVIVCLVGMLAGLVIGNDVLIFTFAFIAIVTSRSLGGLKK
ncbi:MAG: hypothetical protein ABSG05_00920 [Candidatus Pacearchaeota archaeon]|jgi:hypothetical protein